MQAGLRAQLAMAGLRHVATADSSEAAIQLLRATPFDLVLCNYDVGTARGAMHLLEAARAEGLLPGPIFVVLASPTTTRVVADSHEHGADDVLRLPMTAALLEHRLRWLLQRRELFRAAWDRLGEDDIDAALNDFDRIVLSHPEWAGHARYLKSKALLDTGRLEQAIELYRSSLSAEPEASWARVGIAKASLAAGDLDAACEAARAILDSGRADTPVEALDVLAAALDEQGDGPAAIRLLLDAAAMLPSAARLRSLGETAHRHRDLHTAHHGFDRLVRSTRGTLAGRDMDKLRLVQVEVDLRQIDNALQGAASVLKHAKPCGEVACAASALQAQAFARLSKDREASHAIGQARESRLQPTPELPTLALAKAEFLAGSEVQAISLLRSAFAIRRDFRVRQSMDNVLADTERQHVAQQIFVPAATDDWAAFRNPVWRRNAEATVSAADNR